MSGLNREAALSSPAKAAVERALLVNHLKRVGNKDESALADVYRMTSAKINGLLVTMLRSHSAAEEVLQEVFLTVWRSAPSFDPDRASPITWLVTIARNKAIDRIRSERGFRNSMEPLSEIEIADTSLSAMEHLELAQENQQLRFCLDQLDDTHRNAIRAAFFDGLTYEALALRQGVPVGTMKSRIRRSLQKLRHCLGFAP